MCCGVVNFSRLLTSPAMNKTLEAFYLPLSRKFRSEGSLRASSVGKWILNTHTSTGSFKCLSRNTTHGYNLGKQRDSPKRRRMRNKSYTKWFLLISFHASNSSQNIIVLLQVLFFCQRLRRNSSQLVSHDSSWMSVEHYASESNDNKSRHPQVCLFSEWKIPSHIRSMIIICNGEEKYFSEGKKLSWK